MVKQFLVAILNIYHNRLSPILVLFLGNRCRFHPVCSLYAKESIERYGVKKGVILSVKRLFKCHPFTRASYDPVPLNLT